MVNKTFPDGTTHKRYDLRTDAGHWLATVFLGAEGVFSTVSDYGNYGYWWGAIGGDGDIRRFLCGCGADYLISKFNPKTEYDDTATEEAIREHIATLPKEDREMEEIHLDELESSGDFRAWCDETEIEEPWQFLRERSNLQWLLLTKRPENVRRMVPREWLDAWPANVMPGFTAENQEWFDRRAVPAIDFAHAFGVRWFVSYEPALGPIDFMPGMPGIAWLIMGGESGGGARPMMLSWVRSARDQAVAAGVPFFLKQKVEGGKKVSLPLLDGRQWAEMPVVGGAK